MCCLNNWCHQYSKIVANVVPKKKKGNYAMKEHMKTAQKH